MTTTVEGPFGSQRMVRGFLLNNQLTDFSSQNLRDAETDELDRGKGAKEFGMSEDIVSALEGLGHKVRRSGGETSGLHIIYRQSDGTLIGGADPRREGTAQRQ